MNRKEFLLETLKAAWRVRVITALQGFSLTLPHRISPIRGRNSGEQRRPGGEWPLP